MSKWLPEIRFDGDAALQAKLAALDGQTRRVVSRRALARAAVVLRRAIREASPTDRGELRKSIRMLHRSYRRGAIRAVYVGPDWPRGAHGHLVEMGTRERYTAAGLYRGEGPAEPFVRPSFENLSGELSRIIATELAAELRALI